MSAELDLLLRLHDGDDRCGCLRQAILLLAWEGPLSGIATRRIRASSLIRECLEQHPAGSVYRSLNRPVE